MKMETLVELRKL